ncbi:hypothetical protein DFJ73DRAFT_175584 [Zopfochytrium polystomum]|nr:hypothetical protein DFJ73DRAFT_175584 [Zopfochytrium polystomum]
MLVPGRNIAVADLKSRETLPPASAPHVGQRIRGQTQAADPRAETKVRRIARAETVQNEVDSTELEQTETSGPETSVYDSLDTVGDQGEQSETDIPQSMIRTNQSHGTKPSKVRDRKRPVPEGKEERPAPSEREASKHRQDDATLKKEWANSKPASISTRLQKSDDDTSLSSNSPPRRSSLQADTRPSASIEKPRQTESKNTPAEAGGDNEGATGASTTGTSPRVSLSLPDAGLQNATPSQPPQTSIVSASGANIDDVPIRTGASLPNEAAEKPQPTRPCRCCGRRFALDRIEKHEGVCTRANSAADGQTQTKKKYDPAAARRHGTELEGFQSGRKSATELKRIQDAERAKHAWKEKHEELIQSLRAAKHLQQHLARGGKATDIPVPPPSRPNGVQCPSCLRMFNENSIEKHQEICERLKAKGRPIKVNPRFSAATSIGKSRGRGGIDSPL